MEKIIVIIGLIFLFSGISAQQTRTEKVNVTNSKDDSKENSDLVPDVYSISGQFKQVLIWRFKYKTDLLSGIDSMVKELHIQHAVILSGIGSVRGYHVHVVSNRTFPSKNIFIKDPSAPADIDNINGYIINGRVHAHITLADADKSFGGHLEPGTSVFTFAVVTIGVLSDDVNLDKIDDKNYR